MDHAPRLTDADLAELTRAVCRSAGLRRAAGIARFNGWTLGLFAGVSLLAGLWGVSELVAGLVLAGLAWGELSGARGLMLLNPKAPRRLALNQIALAVAVVGYAAWKGFGALSPPPELSAHASELDSVLGPGGSESLGRLSSAISLGVYGAIAVGSIVFQGLTAWYYASRTRLLRDHVATTPEWILRVERIVRAA